MVFTYHLVKLLQNSKKAKEKKKQPQLLRKFLAQVPLLNIDHSLQYQIPDKNKNETECPSSAKEVQNSSCYTGPSQVSFPKCRVCLKPLGTVPIFHKYHNIPLSLHIKFICDIDITANDIYPKHLCGSCFKSLESAIKLRSTAKKTQLRLKKIYSSCQNRSNRNNKPARQRNYEADVLTPSEEHNLNIQKNTMETQLKSITINSSYQNIGNVYKADSQSKHKLDGLKHSQQEEEGNMSDLEENFSYSNKRIKCENESDQVEYDLDAALQQKEESSDIKKTIEIKPEQCEKYFDRLDKDGKGLTFQCRICKKIFKKYSCRLDHFKTHLPDSMFQYMCEVCGKTFKTYCSFYQHQLSHSNKLLYQCDKCPFKGRYKDSLNIHYRRMHIREYNHLCTQCPEKFLDLPALKRHLRRHAEPKYHCPTCNRSFFESFGLKEHIRNQHMNVNPHECDICGNIYKRRKNLLAHQIKVHKRKKMPINHRANYLKLQNVTVANES